MRTLLERVPTATLVEELRRREGVNAMDVEPYTTRSMDVEGPAVILVVID